MLSDTISNRFGKTEIAYLDHYIHIASQFINAKIEKIVYRTDAGKTLNIKDYVEVNP